ncbi:hypothetical protein [Corallococcus exiguus]|uniref:hypothetical protein n=1 Tax=Corallococcus exiguus TaxID=83462 RepID=UPI00155FB4A4|nr:hypothetical protein [Corallococcus exiguus]NRD43932.1 hypothetical protein [Corallococcus exiguus]
MTQNICPPESRLHIIYCDKDGFHLKGSSQGPVILRVSVGDQIQFVGDFREPQRVEVLPVKGWHPPSTLFEDAEVLVPSSETIENSVIRTVSRKASGQYEIQLVRKSSIGEGLGEGLNGTIIVNPGEDED